MLPLSKEQNSSLTDKTIGEQEMLQYVTNAPEGPSHLEAHHE